MFKERTPVWILAGGFFLTLGAGAVNAVGYLSMHRQGISHLTGTVSLVSVGVASSHIRTTVVALSIAVSFFVGAFLSGCIIRQSALHMGRRYGVVLTLEAVLLCASIPFFQSGSLIGDSLAAMACGLQNGMATSYSGAVIRSTHMTGIVTDLGIAFGHLARGLVVDWFRMRLYATLLGGFALGGVLGAWGFAYFGYATLLFPAGLTGATGLGYTVFKHFERARRKRADDSHGAGAGLD